MVEKARKIVTQVDALRASTRIPHGPLTGPLNLGVIPTLAPYLLPRLLPLVKSHYKRLQLVVHEDLTGHLLERLRGYRIDAALLSIALRRHLLRSREIDQHLMSKGRAVQKTQCE